MTNRRITALDAMEEATALMQGLQFVAEHGAYVRGSHSSVTVFAHPATVPGTHRIKVVCYMPGNLAVQWTGLAVFLEHDATGDYWLDFLDSFGRAEFNVIAAPDRVYTLSSSFTAAQVTSIASVSLGADEEDFLETETRVASADGLVKARLVRSGYRQVVEFQTDNARVARDRIHCSITDLQGTVLHQSDGRFEVRSGGNWIARFELEVAVPAEAVFRFAVLSPRR